MIFDFLKKVKFIGKDVYTIPDNRFDLYGIYYSEKDGRFLRMPLEVAKNVNSGVKFLCTHTAGGRLRFKTDSKTFGIYVERTDHSNHSNMSRAGCESFVLLDETDADIKMVKTCIFNGNKPGNYTFSFDLPFGGEMRSYILHFPTYTDTKTLKIALDAGSKVESGKKYRTEKPILYYGSSITQGGAASRADNSYQALIAKWNNIDFINLGFSGSAKAEDTINDYLSSIDASLFVMDYDHNAPDAQYLAETHYRFYKRFRSVQKTMPIIIISKPDIDCDVKEGEKRRQIVRETYEKAIAEGDKNVYYIDGKDLFGTEDRENCTVDTVHPGDLGFYRMAKVIYAKMKEIDEIFA